MVYFQWNLKSSLNSIRKSDLIKLFNACKWLFNLALKYVSTIKLLCWYFSVFTRKRDHWSDPLISDLIPKISQKSENFGKILWPYFSVSKTDPKMKFDFFFADAIVEQIENWTQNLRVGYLPEKWKILKKIILYWNQRKILSIWIPTEKVFDPWIKSNEAFSFLKHQRF